MQTTSKLRGRHIRLGALAVAILLGALGLFIFPHPQGFWRSSSEPCFVACFNEVGSLKVQAPVKLAGVTLGRVQSIRINPEEMRAEVRFTVTAEAVPWLSPATQVVVQSPLLMGEAYLSLKITPGHTGPLLKEGYRFRMTQDASSLEGMWEKVTEMASALFTDFLKVKSDAQN